CSNAPGVAVTECTRTVWLSSSSSAVTGPGLASTMKSSMVTAVESSGYELANKLSLMVNSGGSLTGSARIVKVRGADWLVGRTANRASAALTPAGAADTTVAVCVK